MPYKCSESVCKWEGGGGGLEEVWFSVGRVWLYWLISDARGQCWQRVAWEKAIFNVFQIKITYIFTKLPISHSLAVSLLTPPPFPTSLSICAASPACQLVCELFRVI